MDNNEVLKHETIKDYMKRRYDAYTKTILKEQNSEEYEDDLLYCYECNEDFVGECTMHPSQWILNKKIACSHTLLTADESFDEYYNENLNVSDCFCKSDSIKHIKTTLPNGFFLIKSKVENTTYGIWTKNFISRGTILGPFIGKLIRDTDINISVTVIEDGVNDFIWSLLPTNNVGDYNLIDARDCMNSNYMRFIRRSCLENGHNLNPVQFDGKIFYQAIKNIDPNEELMVNYTTRTFRPQRSQGTLTIRVISHNDFQRINESKSTPINDLKSSECVDLDVKEPNVKISKFTSNKDKAPKVISSRFQPKVDEEMKNCLKEIFLKHPTITGTVANQLLRKMLPDKPTLSDRTVLTVVKANRFRTAVKSNAMDDKLSHNIVEICKKNPKFSSHDATTKLESLFPERDEAFDRRINGMKRVSESSKVPKISSEMIKFIRKMLTTSPWMNINDLCISLRLAFPNTPAVSTDYLSKFVIENNLRPVRSSDKRVDLEMKRYIIDLHFNKGLRSNQICWKLREKYPNRSFICESFVARIIATHKD